MLHRIAVLTNASACLAGCSMAPTYRRPAAPVSATWPTGAAYKDATGKPADRMAADVLWWEFVVDPQLQQLFLHVSRPHDKKPEIQHSSKLDQRERSSRNLRF